MIALVSVTFEVVASGDTEEEVLRDALNGVRSGFRGVAVHFEMHDCRVQDSPAAASTATTNHPGAEQQ